MTEETNRRMADVNHTHPHTGETFGEMYRRGPAVADGGERRDAMANSERDATANSERDATANSELETMADVDHESPTEDVAGVWDRGLDAPDVPGEPNEDTDSKKTRGSDD